MSRAAQTLAVNVPRPPATQRPAIRLENIRKTYGDGDTAVHAIGTLI